MHCYNHPGVFPGLRRLKSQNQTMMKMRKRKFWALMMMNRKIQGITVKVWFVKYRAHGGVTDKGEYGDFFFYKPAVCKPYSLSSCSDVLLVNISLIELFISF